MAAKKKAAKAKVKTSPSSLFKEGKHTVEKVNELNLFDLDGSKAGTKGTSNKFYHAELHYETNGDKAQIHTIYGATGRAQKAEYRHFEDKDQAAKEYEKILSSKRRKGYNDIDVAQRSLGTSGAQKITKAVKLKNAPKQTSGTVLHEETSRVVSELMGATNNFVIQTLKCPLGQLSNDQIDAGRDCLNQARNVISKRSKSKDQEIADLTNRFYGLIPHNLGVGARGKMTHLLLDSKEKIDQKEYDLDTLLDAKAIGATLVSDSVYDQYLSLDTVFGYIDPKNQIFKWLDDMIQKTKASNHRRLGRITLLHAWDIQRKDERNTFLNRAKKIATECGRQVIPDQMSMLVQSRSDVSDPGLYQKANVIPLFHGTRTQNITGILKKGMLIRPSGVVITGAMYGNAIYWGKSTKSINYTNIRSSHWVGGSDDRAFLFVGDCALGSQKIASRSVGYTAKSIDPHHSVWAKGGISGVINDEFMLYRTDQHNLKYLLEFTCQT